MADDAPPADTTQQAEQLLLRLSDTMDAITRVFVPLLSQVVTWVQSMQPILAELEALAAQIREGKRLGLSTTQLYEMRGAAVPTPQEDPTHGADPA